MAESLCSSCLPHHGSNRHPFLPPHSQLSGQHCPLRRWLLHVPVRCGLHRDGWQPAVHSVSWSSPLIERRVKQEVPPSYNLYLTLNYFFLPALLPVLSTTAAFYPTASCDAGKGSQAGWGVCCGAGEYLLDPSDTSCTRYCSCSARPVFILPYEYSISFLSLNTPPSLPPLLSLFQQLPHLLNHQVWRRKVQYHGRCHGCFHV